MLVTVQSKGTQTPLIIGPLISGDGLLAERISEALGLDYPVYKIERLSKNGIYVSDFQEMAQIYERQIIDAGLKGPYQLLGFSFGAQVIYALAVRMQEQKRSIGLVGILDDSSDVHRRVFDVNNQNRNFKDVITSGRHALDRNPLVQYAGKVTVFGGDHWMGDRQEGGAFDWQYLAHGGVDFVSYPCNHNEINFPEWLETWIEPLKSTIVPNPHISRLKRLQTTLCKRISFLTSSTLRAREIVPSDQVFSHVPSQVRDVPKAAWDAFTLSKQGDLTGEIQNYEIARTEQPDLPEWALINLATAYAQQEEWDSAIEVLIHASRASTKVLNSHFELARLLDQTGRDADLHDLSKTVKNLSAGTSSDLQLKANILRMCKEIHLSEKAYRQALKLDPLRTVCYKRCAIMLSNNGFVDKAIDLVEAGVRERPQAVFLRELLAQLYAESRDDLKAETLLRNILAKDPTRPLSVIPLCKLLCRQGKTEEALELVELALKKIPWQTGLLNAAGEIYLETGQLDLAKARFEKSVEIRSDFPKSWLGLSQTLEKMEQPLEAIASLRATPYSLHQNFEINKRISEIQQRIDTGVPSKELEGR